ncbi:LysR family transcriptional regulator [Treponema sp.]|uniref:LysR family transcriptional regulator n=1 Tax=Treponema sp. TaxID=166 RepID=UPI003EFE94F7
MTLQQLHYIIGVTQAGSLNKAAESLYISQPSLTAAIKEVEKEFNISIFNRSSRGISLTQDGRDFIQYARQIYAQYENLLDKFGDGARLKKKFSVSCQHYSFATKSFVELVKKFGTSEYEFSIYETKTLDVIENVATQKSEIGILYMSDFNRKAIRKILNSNDLVFEKLIDCKAYVYLWKKHPLAKKASISLDELKDYPCLSFDQGGNSSFYFAEEILTENEYPKTIKTSDRATNLNLMVGLNGYTLCSGIICEELNGSEFVAVPFKSDRENPNSVMEIGYIVKRNIILSRTGEEYIGQLKAYLAKL